MSVLKTKRDEASSEFVNTARELSEFTLSKCLHFPKRYTFYIGVKMTDLASDIYRKVIRANAIHVHNAHECQIRIDLLTSAEGDCRALAAKIEEAKKPCNIPIDTVEKWAELIDREERLLAGQKRLYRSKLKEYPEKSGT